MQVLAFPAVYKGDKSKLPLYQGERGEQVLQIKFGPHVDLELVQIFCVAAAQGCQWIEICGQERPEMRRKFVNLTGEVDE